MKHLLLIVNILFEASAELKIWHFSCHFYYKYFEIAKNRIENLETYVKVKDEQETYSRNKLF